MPKKSKYPKLRVHVKRGRDGQVWTSYWYDMRGTGQPDRPLGTDREAALRQWAEIHLDAPRVAGTLEEAFRGWEERGIESRADGTARSPVTISGYRKCLRALRKPFGRARWEEVTLPVLHLYVKTRSAKGRARQEMQLLSVIWGWARLEGMTALPWPAVGMQKTGWKGAAGMRHIEVADPVFEAIHRHGDQCLRDALDIASACGLRVTDVLNLRLSDVRNDQLHNIASKGGKRGEYDMSASAVLLPILERRRAMRGVEHIFVLAAGKRPVTYARLKARFDQARALAAKEVPECSKIWLRDMRKYAAQQSGSLEEASKLLQHSSLSVTQRHYRQGDKLKPVR